MAERYAARTEVPADRTRTEIERTLTRFGASAFAYAWDEDRAALMFVAHGRQIRMVLPIPKPTAPRYQRTATGRIATQRAAADAHAQDVRTRWRALLLVIKAKLAAVDAGIVSFETEFLPFIVLPSGQTVADTVTPAIEAAYATGEVQPLLPAYGAPAALPAGDDPRPGGPA